MKSIFDYFRIAAISCAAILFAACGDDNEPAKNPGPEPAAKIVLSTVNEAVYRGDANNNRLGLYTLTLVTEGHELYLEFTSALDSSAAPMPEEGTYDFSAENALSTFNGESYWIATVNGANISRRLTSGSFTLTATETGCKIAGKVAGQDEVPLEFVYEGTLEFTDLNGDPASDAISCLSARGTYYGFYYIPNAANYYIVIFDTVHLKEGDPYSYRVCLDFTSARPSGGKLLPAQGTYRPDDTGTFAVNTFVPGMLNGANGTLWQVPSSDGGSTRYMVTDGFFTIREVGNNKYQIFGTLKDNYGRELSFDYVGALVFNNEALGPFTALTENFVLGEAYYANQKCYDTSGEENLWKIYFYNEKGWTSQGKQGNFVTFDIPLGKEHKSIPAGEYSPAAHVLFPETGNYIPGYIFAYDTSLQKAYGSWLARGNGENSVVYAPIRGGKLTLVENADNTYTATFDVTDDLYIPNRITGSFTGEIPLTSDSQVSMIPRPVAAPERENER